MDLNEYQRLASLTDQRPAHDEASLALPLMGLASEIGSLVRQYKKRVRDGSAFGSFHREATNELGDILWYVSNIASKLGASLQEVADVNLARVNARWPSQGSEVPSRLLDDGFPATERLPRRVSVDFSQVVDPNGEPKVVISAGGRVLGDPLVDMAWSNDDYRFHDAFHLTYAALLGWSPITRAFFGRQRDSSPRFREIEDSGRAKVVEEAVAAIVFEYARDECYLEGVSQLDFSLLETVARMTKQYEVSVRTTKQWEWAILRSFEVWRELRQAGGGSVYLDLINRRITVTT